MKRESYEKTVRLATTNERPISKTRSATRVQKTLLECKYGHVVEMDSGQLEHRLKFLGSLDVLAFSV